MVECPVCNRLITSSVMSYKTSSGFLDEDGIFHEDVSVVVHFECSNDSFNPVEAIEKSMKEGI